MVAPRRASSCLSLVTEERTRKMPSSSKSTESLYSNTSSSKGSATVLYRRNGPTNSCSKNDVTTTKEIHNRVLSARRLRIKNFQNQLTDAQQHIAELAHENRMLRTLHKRQDLALARYESTNAELPKLLHSHAEEIRVWQTKYRNIQTQNKELLHKLKQKESHILSLSDQNKYLSQLNKDKNLEERQRLVAKVQQLETRLQEKEHDMKLLARRLQLESKSSKKVLSTEQKRRKEAISQLEKVKTELSGYMKIDELNLNERLTKLTMGSMTNISNRIEEVDEDGAASPPALPSPDKKDEDADGEQTNRSLSTIRSDNYKSSGKSTRKLSSKKMVRKTSTHRGNGDGPSDEDQSIFTASARTDNKEDDIDAYGPSKYDQKSFYDVDFDDDADPDEIENLLEITMKGTKEANNKNINENMNTLRRELTEDFKKRESFLDTFCRQSTADSTKTEGSRKIKLLAALKAIDSTASKEP